MDGAQNVSVVKRGTFRTRELPDTRPPLITLGPVATGVTNHSATVRWTTDEPATSAVEYGEGTDYGRTEVDSNRGLDHLVRLTNLDPSTVYHVRVTSIDGAGNSVSSEDYEFITQREADRVSPRIVGRPFVVGRFMDRLLVQWETDEPSAGLVEYGVTAGYGRIVGSDGKGRVHSCRKLLWESNR